MLELQLHKSPPKFQEKKKSYTFCFKVPHLYMDTQRPVSECQ